MDNYNYGRGYVPTNVVDTIGNYGSPMQPMQPVPTFQQLYPQYDTNNMTADSIKAFQAEGLNPITGEAIKPTSFADMSGLQKLSAGLGMIGNLSNIWSGIQQNRLARDNFDFQKGVMSTNLANQISSYNTALEDRVAGRYSDRERAANQTEINDYLDRNRAVNRMG